MNILAIIFVICGVTFHINADKIDDANRYFDEVLSVYVPWALRNASLESYEMPNFSYNYQIRSHDGRATTGKIYYHNGNLTGVQSVSKKMCKEPVWIFGNITAQCTIVFPKITVKYEARLQIMTSISDGDRNRHIDFDVAGEIMGMIAALEISASPHIKIPTIRNLSIVDSGRPLFRFSHIEDLSYETVSSHFYHKFNELFHSAFYDLYRKAFERAVESVHYPFE